MWDEFNIKTFPAETAVFRNGVFCPELSTIVGCDINRKYARPVHIIYVGEIAGNCRLDVNINVDNQNVFIDVRVKNKLPAFFNIFIKNAGKNSECRGHILMENYNDLKYECMATHVGDDTTILVKNKLVAGRNTKSKLSAVAIIEKNSKKQCNAFLSDSEKNSEGLKEIVIAVLRCDNSIYPYTISLKAEID